MPNSQATHNQDKLLKELFKKASAFVCDDHLELEQLIGRKAEIRKITSELIANAVAPKLVEEINKQRITTYAEKQHLCNWVNRVLRECQLSMLDPVTNTTAFLRASSSRASDAGRIYYGLHSPFQKKIGSRFQSPCDTVALVEEIHSHSPFAGRGPKK